MSITRVLIDINEFADYTGIRSTTSYFNETAILIAELYIKNSYFLATRSTNELQRLEILNNRKSDYYSYLHSIFTKISAVSSRPNEILNDMLFSAKNIKKQLKFD